MTYFYEHLKSMLLGELKKKYTTTSNTNVVAPNIKSFFGNFMLTDKTDFDNLLYTKKACFYKTRYK